mmetsp:Transcript_31767/g.56852  ORF Transcript_31767/g.56852 Transcript_31767/m.56852 type:complete len:278 (-) Transcript_31767:337-1170(-)
MGFSNAVCAGQPLLTTRWSARTVNSQTQTVLSVIRQRSIYSLVSWGERPRVHYHARGAVLHLSRTGGRSSHRLFAGADGSQRGSTGDGELPERIQLRDGREDDLRQVASAVFSEKMNPLGLHMERFVVAEETATGEVVGFGQLKEWPCLADRKDLAGQVVRTAGLTPNWEGELVEVGTLIVSKQWRGRGIGSAVVKDLLRRAEGRNICLITLASSVPFYERLGFKVIPSEEVPRPLRAEVFWGTIVARLAVNDRVVCMAHGSTIERNMLKEDRWLKS